MRQFIAGVIFAGIAAIYGYWSRPLEPLHEPVEVLRGIASQTTVARVPTAGKKLDAPGGRVLRTPVEGVEFWRAAIASGVTAGSAADMLYYERLILEQAAREPKGSLAGLREVFDTLSGEAHAAERAAILMFAMQIENGPLAFRDLALREMADSVSAVNDDAPVDEKLTTREAEAAPLAAHALFLAGCDSVREAVEGTVEALKHQPSGFVRGGIFQQLRELKPEAWNPLGQALVDHGYRELVATWRGMSG